MPVSARKAVSIVLAGALASTLLSSRAEALSCRASFPEACASCNKLAEALMEARPGETHWRGLTLWTPLYSAYFKNCPDLFESLLKAGASPMEGGTKGDLITTIATWPRFGSDERLKWLRLLISYGASLDALAMDGVSPRTKLEALAHDRADVKAVLEGLAGD